ncbi:hypothetical protein WDW86_09980 [Bdellovibrionota bacterium FG-2]
MKTIFLVLLLGGVIWVSACGVKGAPLYPEPPVPELEALENPSPNPSTVPEVRRK